MLQGQERIVDRRLWRVVSTIILAPASDAQIDRHNGGDEQQDNNGEHDESKAIETKFHG